MQKLQWEIYVPIFRNRFFLRDAGLAIGIPFGIVVAFILIASRGNVAGTDAKYALGLIGLLFLLSIILILIVYGGKYAPGFIVDEDGITNYTQEKHAKRNSIINRALIILGLISGRPSVVGTGMMANARQVVKIKWVNIRKARYYPNQNTILVWGGFAEKIAVFCTPDNYTHVEAVVKEKLAAGSPK